MFTKKIIYKAKIEDNFYFDLRNKKRQKVMEMADLTMFWGLRGNGKSYSSKEYVVRRVVDDYLKNGVKNSFKQFGYVRRTKELIDLAKTTWGARFIFKDGLLIESNKNGIWLVQNDPYTNKKGEEKVHRRVIGRLGVWGQIKKPENNKSLEYDEVDTLFIDEFVNEQGQYLPYEPERLASLIESVGRNKKMTIFMCGNSVSPENPYFNYYGIGLEDVPPKNWIYVFQIENEDGVKNIAIEHVGVSERLKTNKKEGTAGRLASGTVYGDYSFGNKFLIDNGGQVLTNPKERLEFKYNVRLFGKNYEVHSYGKWGSYIRQGREWQGTVYYLTKQDAIEEGKQSAFTNPEWFYFFISGRAKRGQVFYQNVEIKENFNIWLTKIKAL